MTAPTAALLTDLLKQVSRSFYTSLRILPRAVRRQISLAYLLARATDTIADTQVVSLDRRLSALRLLRERILGVHQKPLGLGQLAQHQASHAERVLLERVDEVVSMLDESSHDDQQLLRAVLQTITSGQELDLTRFAGASVENIIALTTDAELDDYTYRVAGCVGEFWTKMCRSHLFPEAPLDDGRLLANAVRFGKGLQLVNILRDLPEDLRQGRCYLPAAQLIACGLKPSSLLHPESETTFRPLYEGYLTLARSHLGAGWDYTNALPRSCIRVRLACAWPILIGVRTLARLGSVNVLQAGPPVKVSRAEVRRLVLRSALYYPCPDRWRGLYDEAALTPRTREAHAR